MAGANVWQNIAHLHKSLNIAMSTRPNRHRLVASCQFYRLVATCQQVATNLLISSSCNKSVKIRLVASCSLSFADLLQLFATTCSKPVDITSLDNQLATSLLTNCYRLVVTSCHKPCKHILISACNDNKPGARCQQTYRYLRVYGSVIGIEQCFFILYIKHIGKLSLKRLKYKSCNQNVF